MSLDELISKYSEIYLIKIDIEGAESDIWPILVENSEKFKYLLVEIHDHINPLLRKEMNKFINEKKLQGKWFCDWI